MFVVTLLFSIGAASGARVAATPSEAAAEMFREACVRGELNLSPQRGRILKGSEVPGYAEVLDWGREKSERTYIKLTYPPSTYLVIAQYGHVQRHSIVRSCALVSSALTGEEAVRLFLEGLPEPHPRPVWWPNSYGPFQVADYPELGFRKSLRFRNDGSVVLQVGMYASPAVAPSSTEPKKQ